MKILVAIKRVPDSDTRIRIKSDGSDIVTDDIKFAINPFDAIAIEESLRIKERIEGTEVTVATIGNENSVEQLRIGLAMGADRAVLIRCSQPLDSLAVARGLAGWVKKEAPDLVLLGKQAIDDDSNQAGQMLAAMLSWAQVTFASKIEFLEGQTKARCSRETDAGIEVIQVRLPAVITTDLRLNEPRYVSLPGIMKAKRKLIEELGHAELAGGAESRTTVRSLRMPPARKPGVKVGTVDELIAKLKSEAKVL